MAEKKQDPEKGQADVEQVQAEVQDAVDEVNEQGFLGTEVDPTPNENYTVAGQLAGKPTPESDPDLAAEVGSGKFRTR